MVRTVPTTMNFTASGTRPSSEAAGARNRSIPRYSALDGQTELARPASVEAKWTRGGELAIDTYEDQPGHDRGRGGSQRVLPPLGGPRGARPARGDSDRDDALSPACGEALAVRPPPRACRGDLREPRGQRCRQAR